MDRVHQFKIKLETELTVGTRFRGRCLSSEEVKKQLSVFVRNKVEAHVKKHFKADIVKVKITDDCVSEKTLEVHKKLDRASKEPPNWNVPITVGVPSAYSSSTFVVQMTFDKPVNKRVFILRDSYDRFLKDYNTINTHTRQCYSIVNIEKA